MWINHFKCTLNGENILIAVLAVEKELDLEKELALVEYVHEQHHKIWLKSLIAMKEVVSFTRQDC